MKILLPLSLTTVPECAKVSREEICYLFSNNAANDDDDDQYDDDQYDDRNRTGYLQFRKSIHEIGR